MAMHGRKPISLVMRDEEGVFIRIGSVRYRPKPGTVTEMALPSGQGKAKPGTTVTAVMEFGVLRVESPMGYRYWVPEQKLDESLAA